MSITPMCSAPLCTEPVENDMHSLCRRHLIESYDRKAIAGDARPRLPEGNDVRAAAYWYVTAHRAFGLCLEDDEAWKHVAQREAVVRAAWDRLAAAVDATQAQQQAHPPSASPQSAPEGNEALNHRAQAIYDVLMARGLVSPLDGMRKLGVYHAILDGLLVKLDADGEPTQADADAIPLRASPSAPPEGINWPRQAASDEEIALEMATWLRAVVRETHGAVDREIALSRAAWLEEIADRAKRYATSLDVRASPSPEGKDVMQRARKFAQSMAWLIRREGHPWPAILQEAEELATALRPLAGEA